jgi:hypothetical protein
MCSKRKYCTPLIATVCSSQSHDKFTHSTTYYTPSPRLSPYHQSNSRLSHTYFFPYHKKRSKLLMPKASSVQCIDSHYPCVSQTPMGRSVAGSTIPRYGRMADLGARFQRYGKGGCLERGLCNFREERGTGLKTTETTHFCLGLRRGRYVNATL